MPKRKSDSESGKKLKAKSFLRSDCPLACALDIIGDKWTMLILRDLFTGKSRYGDFLASGEGIPSNVLATRLRHLEEAGLIDAVPYQERPKRLEYRLTKTGSSLAPTVISLVHWGVDHIPGTREPKIPAS
jgi:DNA-binding HxlR family transcriptional regulator